MCFLFFVSCCLSLVLLIKKARDKQRQTGNKEHIVELALVEPRLKLNCIDRNGHKFLSGRNRLGKWYIPPILVYVRTCLCLYFYDINLDKILHFICLLFWDYKAIS